jgi:hypothetical protein
MLQTGKNETCVGPNGVVVRLAVAGVVELEQQQTHALQIEVNGDGRFATSQDGRLPEFSVIAVDSEDARRLTSPAASSTPTDVRKRSAWPSSTSRNVLVV